MKKIFWAALLPIAFTACTNDEFAVMETPEAEGTMITLDKNFALGLTKGASDAETRAQLVGATGNKMEFHWLPELVNGEPTADKIGLAWVGPTASDDVYTNYLFEHFAWPVSGKTPSIGECTGNWENMVFMNEEDHVARGEDDSSDFVKANSWSVDATNYKVDFETNDGKIADTKSGYFKTENLTIFGGDYIVYAPYDETLVDVGNLKAKSKTSFTEVNAYKNQSDWTNGLQGIANDAFYVGTIDNLKGGTMANGFTLNAVSGYLKIKLVAAKGTTWSNIKNIAIYSADGIVYEQDIDASKVAAAKTSGNMESCLVAGTEVRKTLINAELAENLTIEAPSNATEVRYIDVPVLPQTIKNASVVLIAEDGANTRISIAGDIVVASNKEALVTVNLTSDKPLTSDQFYVVDMPTFQIAMTKAGIDGANTTVGKTTVTLLTNIVYDSKYTNNGFIVVNRDMDIVGGTITVPADERLILELQKTAKLYMEKDFIIAGGNNCTDCDAEVTIQSKTHTTQLTFGGNVTVPKSAKLNITSYDYSTTNVNIAEGKTLTNDGEVDIFANSILNVDKFVNNNLVNMHAEANKPYTTVTVGTLTNAEDAAWMVDAYTELTVDNLANSGKLTIKATGDATEGEDGTVNVQKSAANNGEINNFGVYNSNGTTTLNVGSTFTDYVGSQYGNKMPTLVKGENGAKYICEVNTSEKTEGDRLGYALGSKMVTTDVRFVSDLEHEYQLNDYDDAALRLKEVNFEIAVDDAVDFVFKNNNATTQIELGGNLTVTSAKSVKFNGNNTKVGGNMTVNCDATINNAGTNSAVVTVGGNLSLNSGSALTVEALKNAVAATELTEESWTVGGNVTVDGNSSLKVMSNAAASIGGNLTVTNGSAEFGYSSYTDVTGNVDVATDGLFNRVLSSETGGNANPAQVWCAKYTNSGIQVNGAAQVVSAAN